MDRLPVDIDAVTCRRLFHYRGQPSFLLFTFNSKISLSNLTSQFHISFPAYVTGYGGLESISIPMLDFPTNLTWRLGLIGCHGFGKIWIFSMSDFSESEEMTSNEPIVKTTSFPIASIDFLPKMTKLDLEKSIFQPRLFFRIERNGIEWAQCQNDQFSHHFPRFLTKIGRIGSKKFIFPH